VKSLTKSLPVGIRVSDTVKCVAKYYTQNKKELAVITKAIISNREIVCLDLDDDTGEYNYLGRQISKYANRGKVRSLVPVRKSHSVIKEHSFIIAGIRPPDTLFRHPTPKPKWSDMTPEINSSDVATTNDHPARWTRNSARSTHRSTTPKPTSELLISDMTPEINSSDFALIEKHIATTNRHPSRRYRHTTAPKPTFAPPVADALDLGVIHDALLAAIDADNIEQEQPKSSTITIVSEMPNPAEGIIINTEYDWEGSDAIHMPIRPNEPLNENTALLFFKSMVAIEDPVVIVANETVANYIATVLIGVDVSVEYNTTDNKPVDGELGNNITNLIQTLIK
jgi:hypothetical protein